GLSQVYGFAKQSQGAAIVRSRLGEGAVITLYLPRSLTAPVRLEPVRPAEEQQDDGRVLLVEDNQAVAEAIEAMLNALGYSVVRVPGAAQALARLEEDRAFDFLLSDIVMD